MVKRAHIESEGLGSSCDSLTYWYDLGQQNLTIVRPFSPYISLF